MEGDLCQGSVAGGFGVGMHAFIYLCMFMRSCGSLKQTISMIVGLVSFDLKHLKTKQHLKIKKIKKLFDTFWLLIFTKVGFFYRLHLN